MDRKKIVLLFVFMASIFMVAEMSGVPYFVEETRQRGESQNTFEWFKDVKEDSLLTYIKTEAKKRRIEPVDAKVDSVWKAIPGYNGLEVDIQATYQKALEQKTQGSIPFVYREIKPRVNLEDLGDHPIYRGNSEKKMASIMINVAWGNEFIIPILDTLDEEQVKATFFFDGSWLKKNIELAKEIQKRGHELENHAYSHPNMSQLSESRAYQEIDKTKKLLEEQLGVHNKWFAPPSGDYNDNTVRIAGQIGLKTVLWTVDTIDWKNPPPEQIVNKIRNKVTAGSLILMHPTSSSSAALKQMIVTIKAKGLQLGTVSETLSSSRTDVERDVNMKVK
ncbi:polysaccharide deacetylase family protein [Paenibacillus sediminis]|uniref:Sporulation protein (Polysaccharide deacetylase family) n=1 Tax=Paenibacillus sediminis TaxID=664909 RepID=A0ABS4H1G7_9BACL|nr:polysaccharide deacetylase family protein [Paenibacillus sediminis]MBP1936373.1 putative sporulation protein (polysaccharide deacetylase family) [Paenibacillus sediminis]